MITRNELISNAVEDCLKELYTFAQPQISWDDFMNENKIYSENYRKWERFNYLSHRMKDNKINNNELQEYNNIILIHDWRNKPIYDCIGPRPYEFYYLPKDVLDEICNSYIDSYRLDSQQNLLDIINILKDYCKNPIVDKYVSDWTDETGFHHPGYRDYDHPDNLEKEIKKILGDVAEDNEYYQHKLQDKFFEFLDMAGNFFNWNRDLNSFNMSVYLGPSPNSNKEAVIENWKKYRSKDIEIDESKYKEEFYGEED